MNPYRLPFGLLAFLGLVAVMPVLMYFVEDHLTSVPTEFTFILGMAVPAITLIAVSSWLQ